MCDLWRFTTRDAIPVGAIPRQIDRVLERLLIGPRERRQESPHPAFLLHPIPAGQAGHPLPSDERGPGLGGSVACTAISSVKVNPLGDSAVSPFDDCVIKLYNGGSFFDPQAIPPADYAAIAERVCRFRRVVVECHPALVGERCMVFEQQLRSARAAAGLTAREEPILEVAMGLETVEPTVLQRLNKRMTLDQFASAASRLANMGVALRAFVLVKPPFMDEAQALYWAQRSIDFAFTCGATVVSLIPTRAGNGALEALAARGEFSPPRLDTLEQALAYGVGLGRGRVFADLWDLERFADCQVCFEARRERLLAMNLGQVTPSGISCSCRAEAATVAGRLPEASESPVS